MRIEIEKGCLVAVTGSCELTYKVADAGRNDSVSCSGYEQMSNFDRRVPNIGPLKRGLESIFNPRKVRTQSIIVVDRELSPYSTSFPCEIVTCQFGKRKMLRVFCKYTRPNDYTGHGHRGRVEREGVVYKEVLSSSDCKPKFYGVYNEPRTGEHWLFLEYLEEAMRISKVGLWGPPLAANWIGRFHAAKEHLAKNHQWTFLKRYDQDYYLGWARRTNEYAGPMHRRYPWLQTVCKHAEELLAPLLKARPTVIHGEYYAQNILYHRGRVCPIDWESAAIADGLIDLAFLTEGTWPSEVVQDCVKEYQQGRWPEGVPAGFKFEETLKAAYLYVCFRWLGDVRSSTHGKALRYFESLQSLLQRQGII